MIVSFIYGPMTSGKTTRLLKGYKLSNRYHLSYSIIKPITDNRAGVNFISTHDNKIHKKDVYVYGHDKFPPRSKTRIVAIDESQFFSIEEVQNIIKQCEVRDTSMCTFFGLAFDYAQEYFPSSEYLLKNSDLQEKLQADCAVCGEPADHTQRLLNGVPAPIGPKVLVGGKEQYEARCDECYVHPSEIEEFM